MFGNGCARCKALEKLSRKVVDEMQLDAQVVKEEDIQKIMEYGIMRTPALVFNELVVMNGQVPKIEELKELFGKIAGNKGKDG